MTGGELKQKDNLVWIDLEMTGLEPEKDFILEIATVVTADAYDNPSDAGAGTQVTIGPPAEPVAEGAEPQVAPEP